MVKGEFTGGKRALNFFFLLGISLFPLPVDVIDRLIAESAISNTLRSAPLLLSA